jgi:hypothetical protein
MLEYICAKNMYIEHHIKNTNIFMKRIEMNLVFMKFVASTKV